MLRNTPTLNQLVQIHILHPNRQFTLQAKYNLINLKSNQFIRTTKSPRYNKHSLFTQLLNSNSKQPKKAIKVQFSAYQSLKMTQRVDSIISQKRSPLSNRIFAKEINKRQTQPQKRIVKQNINFLKDCEVKQSFSEFFQRHRNKQENNDNLTKNIQVVYSRQKKNIINDAFSGSDIFSHEKDSQMIEKEFFSVKKKDKNQSQQQSLQSMINTFQCAKKQSFLKFKVSKPLNLEENNISNSSSYVENKEIVIDCKKHLIKKQPQQNQQSVQHTAAIQAQKNKENGNHLLKPLRICQQLPSEYQSSITSQGKNRNH